MNDVKVSIITGIYHPPADLFKRFIQGCLNQTLEGIEFIYIFDDPNDFETEAILENYKSAIVNNKNIFKIIKNDHNIGVKYTHTKGTYLATGKYIMYLDDDDFFDDNYLETMFKYAEMWNANILKGRAITHYYDELDVCYSFVVDCNKVVNTDDYLFLYNREYILKDFEYEKSRYDTHTMLINVLPGKTEQVIVYELPLYEGTFYHYVRHSTNMSNFVLDEQEIDMTVEDRKVCQKKLQPILTDTIHDVFGNIEIKDYNTENLKEKLREYLGLDKKEEHVFGYDKLKNL